MTSDGFVVSPRGGDVIEMVALGPWSAEARNAFEAGNVDCLVLNYALGFQEPDLEFLRGLSLKKLVVLDHWLQSLDPIYSSAPTLGTLHLTTDPSLTIDLSRFPSLTGLAADWQQVRATIGEAHRLEDLYLSRYSEPDLLPLASSPRLTNLVLKDRPKLKSLRGLENLRKLNTLGIYRAQNLEDLGSLLGATSLRELQLELCRRISTVDALADLHALEFLNVSDCGDLATLEPLRRLTNLQTLLLYGTTKITDGDLSPIAQLPNLKELRMRSRRTYTPSVPEIVHSLQ